MEIEIIGRTSVTKQFIQTCILFFCKELRLENSQFTLSVFTDRGMAKRDGYRGAVFKLGPKSIGMVIDTALNVETLVLTVAHEMVHVKQYAKGQIIHAKKSKARYWMGRPIKTDYFNSPWELEAFSRERILANKIFATLKKKKK